MSNDTDSIKEALGITTDTNDCIPEKFIFPKKPDRNNLPETISDNNQRELEKQQDFEYSRKSIQTLIEVGQDALVNLTHFANTSGGAPAYKEVSTMVTSLTKACNSLVEMHRHQKTENPKTENTQQNAENISNTTTVINNFENKTTTELLEMLENGEITEDDFKGLN